jgi:cytochrome c oxidase accessory protein FixG
MNPEARVAPDLGAVNTMRADGSRRFVHPAAVRGRFIRARRRVWLALIVLYLALPFIHVRGHPIIHLDIATRRFFLIGQPFNAQDLWLGVLLVLSLAFGLLFVTAWQGRAWCGWACPQTVFLEGVYRRIEDWMEGSGETRLRWMRRPLTAGRALRKVIKHGAFLSVSYVVAHAALALFVPVPQLLKMVLEGPTPHLALFGWAMAITLALYFNFAWFREQLCAIVCPYGRLQAAMIDDDSILIGYDARRGEPRGRLFKLPVVNAAPRGDCVDCNRCVTVCPAGIDIRQGLQMECIACAQCIDACDEVMTKIQRPKGLIRYDSLNGLAGSRRRTWRPRLLAYAALLLCCAGGLGSALLLRQPFEANLLRFPGVPFLVEADHLRNGFELHVMNKNPEASTFRISVRGPPQATAVVAQPEVRVESLEGARVPIFLSVPRAHGAAFAFSVEVHDERSGLKRTIPAQFIAPRASK